MEDMYIIKHTWNKTGDISIERGSGSTNGFPKLYTLKGAKCSIRGSYYKDRRTSEIVKVELKGIPE